MALFVLLHRAGPAWDDAVPFAEQPGGMGHMGFMRRLDEEGRMILGGPYNEALPGEPVAMTIVEAEDAAAAWALARTDPSLEMGLLTVEVRPWGPRMGRALNA